MDLIDEQGQVTKVRNPWPAMQPTSGLTHQQCIEFWQISRYFPSLITIVASRYRLKEIGGFDVTQIKGHDFEMWLRLIHEQTWSYAPVATAVHGSHRPGGVTQSDFARSQYFLMQGLVKNCERYGESPGYKQVLQQAAKETTRAALVLGGPEDQRMIRDLAWPYLRPSHRMVFGTLGAYPPLYRFALRLQRKFRAAVSAIGTLG
jgi:hypothetical protein